MAVEVRIPTILRKYSDGAKSVSAEGGTVRDLISDLERRYPGISAQLLTEEGALHRFVNVYVNDEDIRFLGALDAKLDDGDVVAILPAVAGGSGGLKSEARARGSGGAGPSVSPPVDSGSHRGG
jgi:MoaD family protein